MTSAETVLREPDERAEPEHHEDERFDRSKWLKDTWVQNKSAIIHLLLFLLATGVLLGVAKAGAETAVVMIALLGFVALATLWLRKQYVDARDNRQWVIPGTAALVLFVVGLLLLVSYPMTASDLAGAVGLIGFWIGASALITRMRDLLLAGLGGWLAAVGFFGWRRLERIKAPGNDPGMTSIDPAGVTSANSDVHTGGSSEMPIVPSMSSTRSANGLRTAANISSMRRSHSFMT
jgi:hypothetical protein